MSALSGLLGEAHLEESTIDAYERGFLRNGVAVHSASYEAHETARCDSLFLLKNHCVAQVLHLFEVGSKDGVGCLRRRNLLDSFLLDHLQKLRKRTFRSFTYKSLQPVKK